MQSVWNLPRRVKVTLSSTEKLYRRSSVCTLEENVRKDVKEGCEEREERKEGSEGSEGKKEVKEKRK